jgi:hypothetical protein
MADEKTAEQIAAEKAEAARVKAEAAATAKAERERVAAEKKEAREAEKVRVAAEREEKKAAAAAERDRKKAETAAAREASRQPEQNGIRRPKEDGLCGKAWAIFDRISGANGAPASIGESMEVAREQGLNEANVRAEYARWRKFYGISGRVDDPRKVAERAAAAKAKEEAKAAAAAAKSNAPAVPPAPEGATA